MKLNRVSKRLGKKTENKNESGNIGKVVGAFNIDMWHNTSE
jgi:hypothetical protein